MFRSLPRAPADSTLNLAGIPENIVDVVGFVHGGESIQDTMHSWIQDPRVIDQQWTPVSVKQGTGGNWWQ